jgi:phospholipid transport system transporter-binding protein
MIESNKFEVTGTVSFATIPELYKLGCQFISQVEAPIFDLQKITTEDNSGLALLTSLMRFAKQSDKIINFINLPNQLKDMAKLSGLDKILEIN